MPFLTATKTMEEYARWGMGGVTFHVMGEPALHPDLVKIIAQASRLHLRPTLATNGTIIGYEMAKKLFANGLSHMWLSMQTFTETNTMLLNDRIRNLPMSD